MEKIGIMGGSFDPIHYGHLILAEEARAAASLSKIIFIPAKISPFKLRQDPADGENRYAMVKKATEGNPFFQVSDMEIKRNAVSYTIDTLQELKRQKPSAQFFFITGTDAFLGILDWANSKELLQGFSFLVGGRPGYETTQLLALMKQIREEHGTYVQTVAIPKMDISSTEIKLRLKEGKSIRYLLPEDVIEYIYDHQLYGSACQAER